MVLILKKDRLRKLLSIDEAIEAVTEALNEIAREKAIQPPRPYLEIPGQGGFLLNIGYLKELGAVGAKIASSFPANIDKSLPTVSSLIILMDPNSGVPLAVMDGGFITFLKTGAVGGVAVKLLSRRDSENVTLIGAGEQAKAQLIAINSVRSIKKVLVLSRRRERALKFAQEMASTLGLDISVEESHSDAIKNADIIVTATTSTTPVINGEFVPEGAHINGIGSFTPDAAEIDIRSIEKAGRVYVDNYEALNVGDIRFAIDAGVIKPTEVYHLADVLMGRIQGRRYYNDLTVFKSVGGAAYDVAVAWRVYLLAKEKGEGIELDIS